MIRGQSRRRLNQTTEDTEQTEEIQLWSGAILPRPSPVEEARSRLALEPSNPYYTCQLYMSEWRKSFKERFCEVFRCSADDYESLLFRKALFRHAIPLASWVRARDPQFFRDDIDLIREVGVMRSPELFRQEINYFFGRNQRNRSLFRKLFRVRLSGKRLIRIERRIGEALGDQSG